MIDYIIKTINESFQDQVAKPRTSKGHKKLIDQGRKDLVKHGQPFNQARPADKSNAFLAKEEHSSDPDEGLEEISSMSGGSVEGTPGSFTGFSDNDNKKHKRNSAMIKRESIAENLKFKEQLCEMIKIERKKEFMNNFKNLKNLIEFRHVIQDIIIEAAAEKQVHNSTALNYLDELLGNILTTIKADYGKLTSDKSQRDSFRAHLVNGVRNLLELATGGIKDPDDNDPEEELSEQDEVSINIKDDDKFLDVLGTKDKEEEEEVEDPDFEKFRIQDEDQAGALAAYETINKIDTQIQKAYKLASGNYTNEKDREQFYDYLITNLKMHFDVFEDELSDVTEPTTPEYEDSKADLQSQTIDQDSDMGDLEEPQLTEEPVIKTETWGDRAFNFLVREELEDGDEQVLAVLARNMQLDTNQTDDEFSDDLTKQLRKYNSNQKPITPELGMIVKNILNKEK
jgi:hypothetical protein